MNIQQFDRTLRWATQREIARTAIEKLKAVESVSVPCVDYASSCALASVLLTIDVDLVLLHIEIHHMYVRLVRTIKGQLAFGAAVYDFVKNPPNRQNEL